jgi:UDP-2,4-diacetamido-2,4,6-trideoxy-beta-L-altropyranose hydrolase
MNKPKVYIRADGNSGIGLGHVIRSLALAEMLKDDFDCIFVTRFLTDYINMEARKVCDNVIKLPESDDHFDAFLSILSGDEVVVLDNYFYHTDYQQSIKNKGCKLVCIDDIHDKHFVADVVINHAPYMQKSDYSTESYTKCLLGTKYALLRTPFLKLAKSQKKFIAAYKAFICFGGSDYNNITQRVVERLLLFDFIDKIFVVTGGAYLYKNVLQMLAEHNPNRISFYSNIDADQIANIMTNCDFAVVPCSSILWECMAAKLPIVTGFYVDNQNCISDYFSDKNIGCVVGDFNIKLFNAQDILKLSQNNVDVITGYIDGESGFRLKNEIKALSHV